MWTRLRSTVMTILSWLTSATRPRTETALSEKPTHVPPHRSHRKRRARTQSSSSGTLQPGQPRPDDDDLPPRNESQPIRPSSNTRTRDSARFQPNEPAEAAAQPAPEQENLPPSDTKPRPKLQHKPRPSPSRQSQPEPDQDHSLPHDKNTRRISSGETHEFPADTEVQEITDDQSQQPDPPGRNSGQPKSIETKISAGIESSTNNALPPRSSTQFQSEEGQISPNHAPPTDGAVTEFNESSTKHEHYDRSPPNKKPQKPQSAPIYTPPSVVPPAAPRPRKPADTTRSRKRNREEQNRAADIKLRILFERGGYCRATLLPSRPSHLPEELCVTSSNGSISLVALEKDWYQDIESEDLGNQLRNGIIWTDKINDHEWVLSARDLFVLSASATHRGFVSTSRLVLEQDHTVACTTSILQDVEKNLRDAGCLKWTRLESDDGVPTGWVVLRGVVPTRPVPLSDDAGILNVLRPLPDIQIQLDGGIRLRYSNWLSGHPPSILVYGDLAHTDGVFIDGKQAQLSSTGCYTAPDWDADGNHQVWCGGKSATYSLERFETDSKPWPAYAFRNSHPQSHIGICGPLVRSFPHDVSETRSVASAIVQIPRSNPILIGRNPWEVFVASLRADIFASPCVVSPPFTPVWAIPAQPLRCYKPTSRVLLIGDPTSPNCDSISEVRLAAGDDESKWCSMILDAARKGLAVHPKDPFVQQLWTEYKASARHLWKLRRSKS